MPIAVMPEIQILVVGDIHRTEFRESASCLKRSGVVEIAADVETAEAALAQRRTAPEVIVVAQSFPGQFPHGAIDRLRRAAPLARILGLMGSWCEGEMRSGRPWPATARLYWHQWPARCRRQFRCLAGGKRCSFALPATATEEERLLADAVFPLTKGEGQGVRGQRSEVRGQGSGGGMEVESGEWRVESAKAEGGGRKVEGGKNVPEPRISAFRLPPSSNPQSLIPNPFGGLAVVRCRSFETWDWLGGACRRRGLAAVWQRDAVVARVEGATAAVFDCADLNDDELDGLRRLSAALRPAPVVALMSFPRIEDHRRALAAGAAAVLSKPLILDDLFAEIIAAVEIGS
ncbi:MAG: response regulator [Planctomycetes bacterium]|nr:response regulator [Planctomycetota bacterium]MCG2684205.1 response regulator [Planctomycetales bacterium]